MAALRYALLAMVGATASYADLTATVELSNSYGTTSGGEFLAHATGLSFTPVSRAEHDDSLFEVFGVERNEDVKFGTTYYIDVRSAADSGGVGERKPDPLDPRTAYLYTRFITSQLKGYADGDGYDRISSANALQNVIWYLEDELSQDDLYVGLEDAEVLLVDQYLEDANTSGWTDIGDIRIMNLYLDPKGIDGYQDQLVMVPTPGAATLGLVGLIGIIRLRRLLA